MLPRNRSHGLHSWTLLSSSGAKVEVLMRSNAFYIKHSALKTNVGPRVSFETHGDLKGTWTKLKKVIGFVWTLANCFSKWWCMQSAIGNAPDVGKDRGMRLKCLAKCVCVFLWAGPRRLLEPVLADYYAREWNISARVEHLLIPRLFVLFFIIVIMPSWKNRQGGGQ